MTGAQARAAASRWLRLVAADAELSAYLIGVDWDRLKASLARMLITAAATAEATGAAAGSGGAAEPETPGLGWSEAHHRRAVTYLAWVLSTTGHDHGRGPGTANSSRPPFGQG